MASKSEVPSGFVECIALSPGFFGKGKAAHRIREGQKFLVPATHTQGKWFRPVDPDVKLPEGGRAAKLAERDRLNKEYRMMKGDPAAYAQLTARQILESTAPAIPEGKILADTPKPPQPKQAEMAKK